MDYRDFNKNGEKQESAAINKQWWIADEKNLSQSIYAVVTQINEQDRNRQNQYNVSSKLYGNIDLMSLSGIAITKVASSNYATRDRISYNVVQSSIDTVTAKITKNKPKPLFLTSGGDYKMQRRAKKLDKFVDGIFYENDAYALGTDIFKNGAVKGDGFVQVFPLEGRVKFERVMADELRVDLLESFYGKPRQLHRVKMVDRNVLMGMFPEKAEKIRTTTQDSSIIGTVTKNVSDQLMVVESWHLRSSEKAKDGLHTICILGGELLLREEWKKDFFPFARLAWCKRLVGYWAQGAAEQLQNIQLELNKMLWVEQRSFHLAGSFKVLLENGSKVVKEHINNEVGNLVYYTGTKPEYVVPPVLPVGFQERKQFLINAAFEQVGVSQLSATSQKPAGLDSGKAMREFNNIETERFMTIGQAYERFYLELAKLTVDCARDIYASTHELKVNTPNSRFIETIDWKDVELDEEDMITKIFPVSSLPNDPAGRMQTVQEYVQAGWITPRTARRLMDFPDLEMVEDLQNAKEDYLHMILEKIVDDGEFTPPEPFDDLQLAKELFLEYYSLGKLNGMEEEKLEMLRTFNDQVDILIQKALPPQPTGAVSTPQADPMAPPTSDLLQNVPTAA